MNSKPVKKGKGSRASLVTSFSSITEKAQEHLEPGYESLERAAQMVHERVEPLVSEELSLDQGNTTNRKPNRCKRSRNSKQVRMTPRNEKDEPSESIVNPPVAEVTEGKRESSSKKKHKKSKKNKKKYKEKEKCGPKVETQKPEKLCSWSQQWAPRPLPVSTASAKTKRKKCPLRNCSSVKVSDGNLTGVQHEEDQPLKAVNNLRAKSGMVHKFLCLPTSQERPANGKETQQEEEPGADWEEALFKEKLAQDTLRKGRPAAGLHFGILNPFRQSSASTPTPKTSLDESFYRHLRSLKPPDSHPTGAPGNKGLTCLEELNSLCFQNSKAARAMKASTEVTEDYGNSQDLFITQKTFLPMAQSNSNSSSSAEETAGEGFDEQSRSTDTGLLRFGSAALRETTDPRRSGLQSPKGRPCEKGTQTADFFSSPAIARSLRFCQRVKGEQCSEEPVDLSLPSRARAKTSAHLKNRPDSLRVQEDSVNPSQRVPTPLSPLEAQNDCQLLPLSAYFEGKTQGLKSTFVISQNRRSDEGKYVQTFLNESYFFKVKGQLKPKDPRIPLMKKKRKKHKN